MVDILYEAYKKVKDSDKKILFKLALGGLSDFLSEIDEDIKLLNVEAETLLVLYFEMIYPIEKAKPKLADRLQKGLSNQIFLQVTGAPF